MKLILKSQLDRMQRNHNATNEAQERGQPEPDHKPVLKLFTPWGAATWLITEMIDDDLMFGLCDLGMGEPELGYVSLSELTSLRGPFGLKVERDMHFKARKTLSEYADEAMRAGRVAA